MLEKNIEKKLVKAVKDKGGLCLKLNSLSMIGIPDRLILMNKGKIGFVELKQKGLKPRPIQIRRIKDLRKLGFKCFVIDDVERIGGVIDEICST
ncbi:VRR-NUC domain-containing protein [Ligilactobacillus ceti]|uniref:VRR-NUC domain-containing protein n=1 Tax=Ligilactobacillus ceti TaxID=395085 RepID=UPI0004818390|nr:VRR-NUC domain-containing protein [Ligilactobacillus ceti]